MRSKSRAAGALALTACLILVGCAKQTTAPTPTEVINGDKPNANGRVVFQNTFGDAASKSYVSGLDDGDDGNYSFYGSVNGSVNTQRGVGSLTSSGALRWFHPLTYIPRDVHTLPATSTVPNAVIVFGKHSTDSDDDSEEGDVGLYNSAGGALDYLVLASDSSDVFINAAVAVSDSSFLAVGGERIAGVDWPLIVQIVVRAGGQLIRGGHAVLRPTVAGILLEVAALPAAGGEIRLFVVRSASDVDRVDAVRVTEATIAPAAVDWTHDVLSTLGGSLVLDRITVTGTEVYAAGYTSDNRKGTPSNGGLWLSALMISYSTAGDLRWRTVVGLTSKSEFFYDVLTAPDAVYGIGSAATYIHNGRDEFGYGLVTKLDRATGTPVASFTLGSDRYQAEFQAAAWKGTNLVAGGYTEYDVLNGPFRGWLLEMTPTVTSPLARTLATASARAEDAPTARRSRERNER